jgi:hypothetical protein
VLYLGIGGGYDVFGAIPIYETRHHGAVFANLSTEIATMGPRYAPFYPLPFAGARKLTKDLEGIIRHHSIDTIVAVDGGVNLQNLIVCEEHSIPFPLWNVISSQTVNDEQTYAVH